MPVKLNRRTLMWQVSAAAAYWLGPASAAAGKRAASPRTKRFVGRLRAEWEDDGRSMRLLERFGYVDGNGSEWLVPPGATVDGASIPQIFWSITGGPFEGKYRKASVIHDWACDVRDRPWQDVHRVFYEMMIVAGVEPAKAKVMYLAVFCGGPRWTSQAIANELLARKAARDAAEERWYKEHGIVGHPTGSDQETFLERLPNTPPVTNIEMFKFLVAQADKGADVPQLELLAEVNRDEPLPR